VTGGNPGVAGAGYVAVRPRVGSRGSDDPSGARDGPSATLPWDRWATDTRLDILAVPDAGVDGLYHCLPARPLVAVEPTEEPAFSLTVVLDRQPSPSESSIHPFVEQALLGLGLTLRIPDRVLAGLSVQHRPLFARRVAFSLEDGEGSALASADSSGANASAALSATLRREEALGVLSAVVGEPSGLAVRARVSFRTAGAPTVIRLTGSWAAVYDVLGTRIDRGGAISRGDVEAAFGEMVDSGVVGLEGPWPLDRETLSASFRIFLRAAVIILDHEDPESAPDDPAARFPLKDRPHPLVPLDVSQSTSEAALREVDVLSPLEDVLSAALEGRDLSRFVGLVGPRGGSGVSPVPRLVRSSRSRARGSARAGAALVAGNEASLRSLAVALSPDRDVSIPAAALASADVAIRRPIGLAHVAAWAVDDMVLVAEPGGEAPRSLPVVEDPAAPVWVDRMDAGRFWYPPSFVLRSPEPNQDPETSPFRFSFIRSGLTAGLATGLSGMVRFTLERTRSDATRAALTERGDPPADPVPTGNLSVTLEIPFRETGTGRTAGQTFVAAIEDAGDQIVATVDLLDDWVRLAYGALAYPDFQAQPARIRVAYAIQAYRPVEPGGTQVAFGGKLSSIGAVASVAELTDRAGQPVFVAGDRSLRSSGAVITLGAEPAVAGSRSRPRRGSPLVHATPVAETRSRSRDMEPPARPMLLGGALGLVAHGTMAAAVSEAAIHVPLTVMASPEVVLSPVVLQALQETEYAVQTVVREEAPEAQFPCASLGAFYVQSSPGGDAPVGCQDVLRLGEIRYRQYEEITELRDPRFGVYRSLQQPGRFLVVPKAYRITRYGPSEPGDRAFRPVILLYALFPGMTDEDGVPAGAPEAPRYFLTATLQPDIPYHARRDLMERLGPFTPHGKDVQLDYPTDPAIQSRLSYRWALPQGIEEPTVRLVWDTFQVSVSTGLDDALVLTTMIETGGLSGDVTFELNDGLALTSALVLDTSVVGPWAAGPVTSSLSASRVKLTNRIERAVNVLDVVLEREGAPRQRVPVDATIDPDEDIDVVVETSGVAEAYPVYEVVPGRLSLEQLNVFTEDITAQVVFVNQVNYANHDLASLGLEARVKGVQGTHRATMGSGQSCAVELTLPLTGYLEARVIEFQVTKTTTSGSVSRTPWLTWSLEDGAVVGVTWELIQ
jgi:hypothetical protein